MFGRQIELLTDQTLISEGSYGYVVKHKLCGIPVARKYYTDTSQYANEVKWSEGVVLHGKHDDRARFIVTTYASGYDDKAKMSFMDMEMAKMDLHNVYVDDGEFSGSPMLSTPEKFEALITNLLSGLHFLHDVVGCVHNDIKPENVLVKVNGTFALCDFGFATIVVGGLPVLDHLFLEKSKNRFSPI
jgi:serine/threonine protein kinase